MKRKILGVLILSIAAFTPLVCYGQVKDIGDSYFYIESGESFSPSKVIFFKFYEDIIYADGFSTEIKRKLASDPYFCYHLPYKYGLHNDCYRHKGEYLPNMSTSKYHVYKMAPTCARCQTIYWAVSTDEAKTIIRWYETPEGEPVYGEGAKTYFIRVSKDDLLPKTVNHDFLYD